MSIENALERIAVALERLADAATKAATPPAPPAPAPDKSAEKPKASKPTAVEKPAEAKPQPAAEARPAAIAFSDVQAAVLKLVKAVGNAEAAKVLAAFGAKNASTIPPDRYAEFIELVNSKQPVAA